MITIKKHVGFTLVEAMVIMLIGSIMMAASMPLITKRHSNLALKVPHGKYICYRDSSGNLWEDLYKNKTQVSHKQLAAGQQCVFTPPPKSAYFLVQAIGGGGGGAGAGTLSGRGTLSGDSGSIDTMSPSSSYFPWWLSSSEYNTYAGSFTATLQGMCSGSGGGWTGYTDSNGDNILEYFVHYGGSSVCSGSRSISGALNYGGISISADPTNDGCSGYWVWNGQGGSPTDGSASHGGSMTVYVNGSSIGSVSISGQKGGKAATISADGGSGSSRDDCTYGDNNAYISPSSVTYSSTVDSKIWNAGRGGSNGEFKSLFIPSLKKNIAITIGAGGAAAATNTSNGSRGGDTSFGALLSAPGGAGGVGNVTYGPYQVGNYGPSVAGLPGSKSVFSAFELIGGLSASSGASNSGDFGKGGSGGGTISYCNDGPVSYYLRGNLVESSSPSCWDSPNAIDYLTGAGGPQPGNSGALFIIW